MSTMITHIQVDPALHHENPPPCSANSTNLSVALTALLTVMFAVYFKTKYFRWQVSDPRSGDLHLLLNKQAMQILATTDTIAGRVPKRGGETIEAIGHIGRLEDIEDDDADDVAPCDMLLELLNDNQLLTEQMRGLYALCDEGGDAASASVIETWIDEAQGRAWFLLQAARAAPR